MKVSKRKIRKIFYIIISVILMLSVFLNTYLLLKYNVLPFKYLMIYFLLVGLIPILLTFFTVFKKLKPYIRRIFIGIEIIYIIILCLVFFYLNKTFSFLDDFTDGFDYETKNYYVLVNNESDYENVSDLKNKTLGYAHNLDNSIDKALDELNKKIDLKQKETDGFGTLFDQLYNDELESVLIVQSFYDMLSESDETLKNNTKIVYKFSIKEKTNAITKDVDVTKETFNVYLSGIDSYDSVTDKTRSDVNIIASINPNTHKILLINIPRDYYVELDGIGQKDKLTHAGLYGVEMSTKTIENLLDIEINYYLKLNYNALIDLVDALDGVDVYSNHKFTSGQLYHHFNVGYNHVNGEQALEFVRTRKAFLDGDRVRGENQQAMIKAIIAKACSADILIKYDDILNSLKGSFVTNFATEKITSLINMQLDTMPNWEIESISLNGSDSYGLTYTYAAQELYVMIPNEDTIETAKKALQALK
ncbi:MAG: LCP family protein [Bacilli bacterium]|nr:LCP family protein [Bacilli bacterium]